MSLTTIMGEKTTLLSSQSRDLNPIENLWYILDSEMKDRSCQHGDDLFETLQKACENICLDFLTSLIDSMSRRMDAVIGAKGYPTEY